MVLVCFPSCSGGDGWRKLGFDEVERSLDDLGLYIQKIEELGM